MTRRETAVIRRRDIQIRRTRLGYAPLPGTLETVAARILNELGCTEAAEPRARAVRAGRRTVRRAAHLQSTWTETHHEKETRT